MQAKRLKLNRDKTECIWVTTWQRQSTFAAPNLTAEGSVIVPTKGARNLGVSFDSKLDLKSHISNICRTCYFQLRQLRTVHRSLQPEISKNLLHAFVSCRLDYCNSLFQVCPLATYLDYSRYRMMLHAYLAVCGSMTVRDVLHWLPIKERINFKIEVLTNKALNGLAPSYLSEMSVPVAVNPALRRNRSAYRGDITVPRAKKTSYNDRSLAIAAPMLQKSFPVELRCCSSMTIFCKRLKTYLFRATYNIVSPPTD